VGGISRLNESNPQRECIGQVLFPEIFRIDMEIDIFRLFYDISLQPLNIFPLYACPEKISSHPLPAAMRRRCRKLLLKDELAPNELGALLSGRPAGLDDLGQLF
jgi:hypothetical protein